MLGRSARDVNLSLPRSCSVVVDLRPRIHGGVGNAQLRPFAALLEPFTKFPPGDPTRGLRSDRDLPAQLSSSHPHRPRRGRRRDGPRAEEGFPPRPPSLRHHRSQPAGGRGGRAADAAGLRQRSPPVAVGRTCTLAAAFNHGHQSDALQPVPTAPPGPAEPMAGDQYPSAEAMTQEASDGSSRYTWTSHPARRERNAV